MKAWKILLAILLVMVGFLPSVGASGFLGGTGIFDAFTTTGTGTVLVLSTAPAIVGGSYTALTGLGIRDTSAAFDVTIAAVSSTNLTAGRTLTLNMGNVAHILTFGTTTNTGSGIIFPNTATDTVAMIGVANTFIPNQIIGNITFRTNDFIHSVESTTSILGQNSTVAAAVARIANNSSLLRQAAGQQVNLQIDTTFAPTGGTATYVELLIAPTINQTGGASGITRGIYINPVVTAAADFRALEVATGISVFPSLDIVDTSAAFNVHLVATSGAALNANRTLTLNVQNVAHTLNLGTTANTITFPNVASGTVAMWNTQNVFTLLNYVRGGNNTGWAIQSVDQTTFSALVIDSADAAFIVGTQTAHPMIFYQANAEVARTVVGGITYVAVVFASLGTPANGTITYCSNCDPPTLVESTCTSAGAATGSLAFRVNGAWKCLG